MACIVELIPWCLLLFEQHKINSSVSSCGLYFPIVDWQGGWGYHHKEHVKMQNVFLCCSHLNQGISIEVSTHLLIAGAQSGESSFFVNIA